MERTGAAAHGLPYAAAALGGRDAQVTFDARDSGREIQKRHGERRVTEATPSPGRGPAIGRVLGPVLFLALWLLPTGSLVDPGKTVAAVVAWMAVWWVTEAAPIAVTALLPEVNSFQNIHANFIFHADIIFWPFVALSNLRTKISQPIVY